MRRPFPFKGSPPACPIFFHLFLKVMAGNQDMKLSKRVWLTLYKSDRLNILHAINRMQETRYEEATAERLWRVIPPRILLNACLRLSPEGKPRERAIILLERTLLESTRDGGARWRGETPVSG